MDLNFEERAVAFIDILGFKNIVNLAASDSRKQNELGKLISLLSNAVPQLNLMLHINVPKEIIPEYIYISDCIILSTPLLSKERGNHRGLSILVMRVIQIANLMRSNGYLIRGGISVGQVWHSESNIVGPAYQEAYKIETETVVPRVVLSSAAREIWIKTEGHGNSMCLDYKGCFMVNLLHDYYIRKSSPLPLGQILNDCRKMIESNLKLEFEDHVRYKWWWFMEYLEWEVDRNNFMVAE